MKQVRIELNRSGVREAALTSPEVRAAVRAKAEEIAGRARARTGDDIEITAGGRSRARSYIMRLGSGARGEAEDRALGSSLGGS